MKAEDLKALYKKALEAHPKNFDLHDAIRYTEYHDREFIDFDESLWPRNYESTLSFLNENSIRKFTVTSGSNYLMDFLAFFTEHGWKIAGMVKVPRKSFTEKYDNAILLTLD